MKRPDSDLVDRIEERLTAAGWRFARGLTIGGLQPDFLVQGPKGGTVVVEARVWRADRGFTARARDQATSYAAAVGTPHALVVLEGASRNYFDWGVVGIDGLVPALERIFERSPGKPGRGVRKAVDGALTIFASMPFDRAYDDTYFVAMTHAARQVGAAAIRVDQEEFTGDIVEEVKRRIEQCAAVIVDLSEAKPNVLYEAGYAHALGKVAVHICSTPEIDLPFFVRNWNTLRYAKGGTAALRAPLTRRLKELL